MSHSPRPTHQASLFQLVDWRNCTHLHPFVSSPSHQASLFQLVDWRSVLELLLVWVAFLALQLAKQHTPDCSRPYWLLNALQIPAAPTGCSPPSWGRGASLFQLVDWRSVLELLLVWVASLALQLSKQHTPDCSRPYWLLNALQIPVTLLATLVGAWCVAPGVCVWHAEPLQAHPLIPVPLLPSPSQSSLQPFPLPSYHFQASLFQLVDWRSVLELLLVWLAFLALQLAKQHTMDCSRPYWLLNALQIPVALLATLVGAFRLYRQSHPSPRRNSRGRGGGGAAGAAAAGGGAAAGVEASEQQQREGASSSRGEYHTAHWGMQQLWGYPLCSFIAGVMGGLLGIGGGMVMGPVLLELNLPPQVTAATTTFMVVFSSSLSVLEFYLLGRIPIEVALVFAGIAMVAAFTGLSIVRAIVMRYGKPSVIIFALGSVIGLSGIVLGAYGGVNTYHDWMAGANMGFRDLCAREF
ncbi:unnamed protein product [Closterium sp. NIES-54]